jgi:group I intron endonuclease
MKISGIYKITCICNGSVYIGSSSNIQIRWGSHRSKIKNLKHNPKVNSCAKKYGKESFEFSIIEQCDIDILIERETYWADFYTKNGYKLLNCGYFIENPTRGTKHSEERINKIKESLKGNTHTRGTKLSDEHKAKISKSLLGHKMSEKNKKILSVINKKKKSESHKIKLSESKIEKYGIKVICLQTKERFNSLIQASSKIGTTYQNLRQSILRGGKCKGLNYYFLENELTDEEIHELINTDLRKKKRAIRPNNKEICRKLFGKRVFCEEVDIVFKSITEASEYFSISNTTVRNYMALNKKFKNKYSFRSVC